MCACNNSLQLPKNKWSLPYVRIMGGPYKPTKQEIMAAAYISPKRIKYNEKGKVLSESFGDNKYECEGCPPTQDSIRELFRIVEVDKAEYAYQLVGDTLKKRKVYVITLQCISNPQVVYPRMLLSIDKKIKGAKKIKVGGEYELLLCSYFAHDVIYVNHINDHLYIDNVSILFFNTGGKINLYTTPNLKGLYYIPNPE